MIRAHVPNLQEHVGMTVTSKGRWAGLLTIPFTRELVDVSCKSATSRLQGPPPVFSPFSFLLSPEQRFKSRAMCLGSLLGATWSLRSRHGVCLSLLCREKGR